MTLWKNLVVALVAAFALAACSSSSDNGGTASGDGDMPPAASGPTQEDLDEANQRAEDEKKRADDLQAEMDADQAEADRAAAKALFAALRLPLAVATGNLADGETIDVSGITGRDHNVVIPALGKPENGMSSERDGTTQWSAFVSSTQEASVRRAFAVEFEDDDRYVGNDVDRLNFGTPTAGDPAISSTGFPQRSGTRNYDPGSSFGGTYMGAAGTYVCGDDACTATWTLTGIQLSAGWHFKPASGARVEIADASFQTYGWWLRKNADGTIDAGPAWFHSLATAPQPTSIDAIQGTATYSGSALGKYAIYSGAFSERSEAGHFTAAAELTADFGAEDAPGHISGKIDGFMTAAGSKNWEVELERTALASNGGFDTNDDTDPTGTIWMIGDVASDVRGNYQGAMYDARDDQDGLPYEVGGTFSAQFEAGVGQMIGSFTAVDPQ